jgi:hypothetical protein
MGVNNHNRFQKAIRSSKNLFIKLFADVFFRYKKGTVGCTNRIKRLSIGINDWILTKDLSTNK